MLLVSAAAPLLMTPAEFPAPAPVLGDAEASLLRRCLALCLEARAVGAHPFAALLANEHGEVLMEQINAYLPHHDMTGHAERVLMTRASQTWTPQQLARCTLYSSAEPCAMCAGAAYWAGVGRVVYGLGEARLKAITGNHPENPTLDLPCRVVFAAGQRRVEVLGPCMDDEAARVHDGAW